MNQPIIEILKICDGHAARLNWAMTELQTRFPLSAASLGNLTDLEIAVLDQFSTRFGKLQDAMGAKLFPAILELTKEQGELKAFIDKLNRLEKIGAIQSADEWLLLREVRNAFSHDYPDDSELQASVLNQAYLLAQDLLTVFAGVKTFVAAYL
ncbi:MAG: hypothetical protein QX197_13825 [Methylococcaceae bacterium]